MHQCRRAPPAPQLDIGLDSVSELDGLLAGIPPGPHRAWSERMRDVVVDGSPVWHVYHVASPLQSRETDAREQAAARGAPGAASGAPAPPGKPAVELPEGERYMLDWKGDRIKVWWARRGCAVKRRQRGGARTRWG